MGGRAAEASAEEAAAAQVAQGQAERDEARALDRDLIIRGGDLGFGVSGAANKLTRDIMTGRLTGADGMKFQHALRNPEVRRAFAIMQGVDPTDDLAVNEALANHSRLMSRRNLEAQIPTIEGGVVGPGDAASRAAHEAQRQKRAGELGFESPEALHAARRAESAERRAGAREKIQERIADRREAIELFGTARPRAIGAMKERRRKAGLEERLVGVQETRALGELAAGMGTGTLTAAQREQLIMEIESRYAGGEISAEQRQRMIDTVKQGGAGGAGAAAPPRTPPPTAEGKPGSMYEPGAAGEPGRLFVPMGNLPPQALENVTTEESQQFQQWQSDADTIDAAIREGYGSIDATTEQGKTNRILAITRGMQMIQSLSQIKDAKNRGQMARSLYLRLERGGPDNRLRRRLRNALQEIATQGKVSQQTMTRLRKLVADIEAGGLGGVSVFGF
jgi:hypothetical protein